MIMMMILEKEKSMKERSKKWKFQMFRKKAKLTAISKRICNGKLK